jgi:hypothetical protein
MPIAGDAGKVPGPLVRRTMSQSSNANRGQQRHCRVQDRVQLGVILVTALEKQSELVEKNRNANGCSRRDLAVGRVVSEGPLASQLLPFAINQMPSPRFRPKLQSTPPA